jgi:hypothetical protein
MAFDPPRAVPFIVPADDGGGGADGEEYLTINPEAVALLQAIQGPVAPVAVCGRYRTGKSFLLNRLIGAPPGGRGFEVGPTIEACTRGIWLWSEPVELELPDGGGRVSVLFFDTEGMGGYGATAEHDARVFALGVLLSSLVIYNSVGAIDEEAIQQLAFVAHLTKHIQLKAAGGGGDGGAPADDASAVDRSFSGQDDSDDDSGGAAADSDDDDDGVVGRRALAAGVGGGARGGSGKGGGGKPPLGPSAVATSKRGGAPAPSRATAATGNDGASSVASGRSWATGASAAAAAAAASSSSELSDFFPAFLWVLRDFALDLVDEVRTGAGAGAGAGAGQGRAGQGCSAVVWGGWSS